MPSLLVIRPKRQGPGDGYGAFGPGGNRCAKLYQKCGWTTKIVEIDAMKVVDSIPVAEKAAAMAARRKATCDAIRAFGNAQAYVFACHGWSGGFQMGFDRASVGELVSAIDGVATSADKPIVSLNACSTGLGGIGGDGGFADTLRDALCKAGLLYCQVEGHSATGEAFNNPLLRRFEGEGSPLGGTGGWYYVQPATPAFAKFRKLMKETNLKYGIWSLQHEEVTAVVNGKTLPWMFWDLS